MSFHKPPKNLSNNLGLAQQCWHMAHAACDALGLQFDTASPSEIHEQIADLFTQRASNNIRTIHDAVVYGKNIELDHNTGLMSLVEKSNEPTHSQTVENGS